MRVAASFDNEKIGKVLEKETPKNPDEAAKTMGEMAKELSEGIKPAVAAGGIAGVLNHEKTKLLRSPNLATWEGADLGKSFGDAFGCPVKFVNDTIAAGVGEAVFGAGHGKEIVVYITVSTGVGGAKIENGKPDDFHTGFEPGHQIIVIGNNLEPVNLEDLISGRSFEKRWGKDFITSAPKEAWEEAAKYLAVGLHNTIVHWSPDIIVLGGAMITKEPGIDIRKTNNYLRSIMSIFPEIPPIVLPNLGDHSALYGALKI